jgi:hypothetical protein
LDEVRILVGETDQLGLSGGMARRHFHSPRRL